MTQSEGKKKRNTCPYCDEEMKEVAAPFCKPCEVEFVCCSKCGKMVAKNVRVCPYCGVEIETETE